MTTQEREALLGPDDPTPVIRINPDGRSAFLLIGDHAGAAIPAALGTLGLGSADLGRHIALDIGVRQLGEALAARLDAVFIHQTYSRLVIDCNRDPLSPEAMPEHSDGTEIPGNRRLAQAPRRSRIAAIHAPYQAAIAAEITRRTQAGLQTILVSLHSFTPLMAGKPRPWDVGILHDGHNDRFARALLEMLRADEQLVIGDNEPYRMDATDHTVPRHAFGNDLPYAELEIRQDLIQSSESQHLWGEIIATAMPAALKAMGRAKGASASFDRIHPR